MKANISAWIVASSVLILSRGVTGEEIKGKVIEVRQGEVVVATDSGLIPNRGDAVEIYFQIPGVAVAGVGCHRQGRWGHR